MRIFAFASALLISTAMSHAQTPSNFTYFCTAEFAGGLVFNQKTKKWEAGTRKVADKFVLRGKFRPSGIEKTPSEKLKLEYEVTITKSGTSFAQHCEGTGSNFNVLVSSSLDTEFSCESAFDNYIFNLTSNRFMRAYLIGFVEGADSAANEPHIAGGTCTKID